LALWIPIGPQAASGKEIKSTNSNEMSLSRGGGTGRGAEQGEGPRFARVGREKRCPSCKRKKTEKEKVFGGKYGGKLWGDKREG